MREDMDLFSGLGPEPKELIIGESFKKLLSPTSSTTSSSASGSNSNSKVSKSKSSSSSGDSFHSIRYDFKPASVDASKMARIELGAKSDKVRVTVPNVADSSQPETIFTGSKKPHLKECVLIIDHETGEIKLERLTHSINVKKTRVEGSSRVQHLRPSTPNLSPNVSNQGQSSGSQGHGSSQGHNNNNNGFGSRTSSPANVLSSSSPFSSSKSSSMTNNVLVSSPLSQPNGTSSTIGQSSLASSQPLAGAANLSEDSSSSSDSESSSSDSDSSSSSDDDEKETVTKKKEHFDTPPKVRSQEHVRTLEFDQGQSLIHSSSQERKLPTPKKPSMPIFGQLNEDLQLSESGSDSD